MSVSLLSSSMRQARELIECSRGDIKLKVRESFLADFDDQEEVASLDLFAANATAKHPMDFKERVEHIIHYGSIAFVLQIAKEVGIFDVLCRANQPLTSQQLSDVNKLKERYVKEVLGCLTSASLVQIGSHNDGSLTYYLTEEAKAAVQRSKTFVDVGLVGLIGSLYASVKACFSSDGPLGMRYNEEMFKFLDEKAGIIHDEFIKQILDACPGLEAKLDHGIKVLEFGCGTGRLVGYLATRYPQSIFTASEVDNYFVIKLKETWGNLPNTNFTSLDVCLMTDFPSTKFDWVLAVNVLHHLPHPLVGLKNVRKMINDHGGFVTFHEMASCGGHEASIGNEVAAFNYANSTFLCIPDSFQGVDSENHGACWDRRTVVAMLNQAGFKATVQVLSESEAIFVGTIMD